MYRAYILNGLSKEQYKSVLAYAYSEIVKYILIDGTKKIQSEHVLYIVCWLDFVFL